MRLLTPEALQGALKWFQIGAQSLQISKNIKDNQLSSIIYIYIFINQTAINIFKTRKYRNICLKSFVDFE